MKPLIVPHHVIGATEAEIERLFDANPWLRNAKIWRVFLWKPRPMLAMIRKILNG